MKIRQLQYVHEIARSGCNISAAAAALHTAQPGISKQVRLLEDELGVRLFYRAGNRLSGLTAIGEKVLESANRILHEAAYIRSLTRDENRDKGGTFTVATTHTQARYVLPAILKRFTAQNPQVKFTLQHASPGAIVKLVGAGEVDLGVTTNAPRHHKDLIVLPCLKFDRVVIVPRGHELLEARKLSLKLLSRFPMVTYDAGFSGRDDVWRSFDRAGLNPRFVISAGDADVIKSCVEQGLGIAVLLAATYDADRDRDLVSLPAGDLFPAARVSVVIHKQHFLRQFEYDFIEMISSRWYRANVQKAAAST